ncbi:MAG TPA: anaerobic sulfatase maturase [Tepidisphaeraceae bacterium]|jgi:uncharacterized protein|nr:anaerobic sulfatase maturase [Tepidisphaeraceae bacterium]
MGSAIATTHAPFHVMTKPIGPICNLDCKYCFYLEKEKLYPDKSNWRMPDNVLERYIQQYITAQDIPEITFAWQGGEPTLMGLDFFQRVVGYQQKYSSGKNIKNALQTNGTLLDDPWCAFFKQHNFLIGLSIDGPRHLHDAYRVDKQGRPTFDQVMRGMNLLKKHHVEFNNLVVVNRANQNHPLEVYNFLKQHGSGFMQFIPLVERLGTSGGPLDFAEPPTLTKTDSGLSLPIIANRKSQIANVTDWSVQPTAYGDFLIQIFDHWVRHDVGQIFVQIFDVQLGIWLGLPSSLCVFGETCGNAVAMEHNGDLYSCDHYVYPRHHLGNIMQTDMRAMLDSPQQRAFGADKRDTLPKYCRECDVKFACNGECPKHRFIQTPDGEPGLNYLCSGYKKFFHHIDPHMQTMANLLRHGQPAAQIMQILADEERPKNKSHEQQNGWHGQPYSDARDSSHPTGRNDPCPCGSGKKYKKCCLASASSDHH